MEKEAHVDPHLDQSRTIKSVPNGIEFSNIMDKKPKHHKFTTEILDERLKNNPSLRKVNPDLLCSSLNLNDEIKRANHFLIPSDKQPYAAEDLKESKPDFTNKLWAKGISKLPSKKPKKASAKPPKPKKVRMPSVLEKRFLQLWAIKGGPELQEEWKFHPTRKWRADFAHLRSMTLIEVEGGVWGNGRHNRPTGMIKDAEKYLEAALKGWRVIRLTSPQLTEAILERIIWAIEAWSK